MNTLIRGFLFNIYYLIPTSLKNIIGLIILKINGENTHKNLCPYCKHSWYFLPFPVYHPFKKTSKQIEMCPKCGSMSRHRCNYDIYDKYIFSRTTDNITLYHMAPEKPIYDIIKNQNNINYIVGDMCPEQYTFTKNCKQIDATNMPFKDESIDLIISNYIMDQVPDDNQFIKETNRILRSGGIMLLTIPFFRNNKITEEISTDDFHSRKYGVDVISKMEKYFTVKYEHTSTDGGNFNGDMFILFKKY